MIDECLITFLPGLAAPGAFGDKCAIEKRKA
jgi:hypothetical protein